MVADPEVAAALEEAVRVLRQEGAEVRDIRLPRLQEIAAVQRMILLAEGWAVHAKWMRERPGDYATPTRRKVLSGVFVTAGELVHAQQCRTQMIDAIDDALGDVDVLLTANGMDPAVRFDDANAMARVYPRQARSPFNLTGHPALAMMSGLSKSGLPLSLQLVGRAFEEVTLLRVAAGYERATSWHTYRPPTNEDVGGKQSGLSRSAAATA
jgi:aspartyl-tRNA(Asn)/glutamyl-tRNA(Gln) amidotransferase subunit A